jgi:multiple sugar transport system ATP-binding protein
VSICTVTECVTAVVLPRSRSGTLLRVIAGLGDITSGELRIGNRVVNEVPPAERGIALMFQSYALYPHMNLYDNMAFGLKLAKAPKEEIDRAVMSAAKILHIEHLLQRKPEDLSGGQRQRVTIGRAIVRKPGCQPRQSG